MATTEVTPLQSLYAEHHGWLVGWLRKRLGNTDSAADLAQDTFVKVMLARNAQPLQQPRQPAARCHPPAARHPGVET